MTMVATCCAPLPRKNAASAVGSRSLKPCPFCGLEVIMMDRCSQHVECWNCGTQGPLIDRFLGDADGDWALAAILSWNTRAEDDSADSL